MEGGCEPDNRPALQARNMRLSGPPILSMIACVSVSSFMTSSLAPAQPEASGPACRQPSQKKLVMALTSASAASVISVSFTGTECTG